MSRGLDIERDDPRDPTSLRDPSFGRGFSAVRTRSAPPVDLELTTDHYKKGQIAAKAAAGFTLYSLGGDSSGGGSGVREERELTSQILSL